ncbi:MAG: rhodanese-like domain-containing protein, partial [Acidaminobacteraceae bacterium]
ELSGMIMKKNNKMLLFAVISVLAFSLVGCSVDKEVIEVEQADLVADETTDAMDDKLSALAVLAATTDESYVIVDARINDAFNGWLIDGVKRGGHIKGAVDFSANWLNVDNESKEDILNKALEVKGITPDKNVIVYDVNGRDAMAVKIFLEENGFGNIAIFDLNEWANDDSLELVKYANYELIVPAVVVKDILDGKETESFENVSKVKIVEASWGEEETSYAKGHVPTSFHINTDSIEPPPAWMLADDATLEKFAVDHGFTSEDTVIVTGQEQMAAYRVAVALRYIGVKDVRVLNGGTLAWTTAGYELETESNEAVAVESFGAKVPGNEAIIDTVAELKAGLKNPDTFTLVDNRTWEEFIGESSGYSYHDEMGRIEGSVFGYAGEGNSYSLSYYRNIDNTMRRPEEFVALWQANGIDITKHLSFMCGSGWRASEILYYSDVYGVEDAAIYSDGWIGWSTDKSNPIIVGDPTK